MSTYTKDNAAVLSGRQPNQLMNQQPAVKVPFKKKKALKTKINQEIEGDKQNQLHSPPFPIEGTLIPEANIFAGISMTTYV